MGTYRVSRRGDSDSSRNYRVAVWDSVRNDTVGGFSGNEKVNPHSVWKFFQAYATIRSDVDHALTSEETALMCSSHSGQEFHAQIVEGMLAKIGLSEKDLACGKRNFFRSKRGEDIPDQRYCDCSGKHAGFLTLARLLAKNDAEFRESSRAYLDKEGRVQKEVVAALIRDGLVTEKEVASWEWEKDGCGAPVPIIREATLARLYGKLVNSTNEHLLHMFDSAVRHPELIGGNDGRLVTEIAKRGIQKSGDVVLKDGFGSVLALALVDGERKWGIVIHDLVQNDFREDELATILIKTLNELVTPSDSVRETARKLYGQTFDEIEVQSPR